MASSQPLQEMPAVSSGLGRDLVGIVRRMILAGKFPPGERLMPRDLQERFGVSVIPVREALRTLEAEGLVVTTPRRGTRVATLSLAELNDVYSLRRMIEPPLSAAATRIRTHAHVERARRAYERMEAIDGAEMDAWLLVHREFHWSLLDVGLGAVSARTIRQLWDISERYVHLTVSAFRIDKPARHDHKLLIDAFETGDAERLAIEWDAHLHLVEQSIIRDFQDELA